MRHGSLYFSYRPSPLRTLRLRWRTRCGASMRRWLSETPDLIALPEVSYPGYFLGTNDLSTRTVLSPAEAARRFADEGAAARGLHRGRVRDGCARPADTRTRRLCLGAMDALAGRYDKSFLWHFDTRWFEQGSPYPVFETDIGRIGMLDLRRRAAAGDRAQPDTQRGTDHPRPNGVGERRSERRRSSRRRRSRTSCGRGRPKTACGSPARQVRHRGGEHRLRRAILLHQPARRNRGCARSPRTRRWSTMCRWVMRHPN